MADLYDRIQEAAAAVRARWAGRPRFGIILGTGLGALAQDIRTEAAVPFEDVPHFARSTAPSQPVQAGVQPGVVWPVDVRSTSARGAGAWCPA